MAEVLLKRVVDDRMYVASCGLRRRYSGQDGWAEVVDPFAAEVMAEIGCDLRSHDPKTFDDLDDASFDLVVSLTPEAQHRAVELTRRRAVEIEYWPICDPTVAEGSREARLTAYREVREALAARILARFGDV